jgi:hypothetical protein
MYFLEAQPDLVEKAASLIKTRLSNFANHWGIINDVETMQQKHAAACRDNRDALPDSAFAIVWADAEGGKARHLPMRNTTEIKVAAFWFKEHRDNFKWDDRQTIARKILEKAANFGAGLGDDLDELLEKQAGHGVFVPSKVAEMLTNRTRAVDRLPEEVRDRMLKLASEVKSNPILGMDPATSANLARTVDIFDRTYGLAGKYSALIPRPEDVLFAGTLKCAADFVKNACTLTTGTVFEKAQFSKLALSEVRALLGDDVAAAVADGLEIDTEKMSDIASTLPRPDAQKLEVLLSDIGETPATKNAQAVGASADEQARFAAIQDFVEEQPIHRQ